ncbi:hypothetical protein [Paenibacillus popilliae]|nr:hypothetical protein [Paenibacillus popilliae]
MFAYLKGAGASAFVATLGNLPFFSANTYKSIWLLSVAVSILFSYIGCILGWALLKIILKYRLNMTAGIMLFLFLGLVFAFIIQKLLFMFIFSPMMGPVKPYFYFLVVFGSVSFYLAQKITNLVLSRVIVLTGLVLACITCGGFLLVVIA